MKFLTALGIVVLITALSMKPKSIEERVEIQLQESEALQDSAMILLKELHDKNDSLIDKYFPQNGVGIIKEIEGEGYIVEDCCGDAHFVTYETYHKINGK
jgi:hypothetical protein